MRVSRPLVLATIVALILACGVSTAVAASPTTHTATLALNDSAWLDANESASGAWGTYSIYAGGVLIGTKAAGTPTWNCPARAVASGARIDIVENVDFASKSFLFDASGSKTFSYVLPAGTTRLEAATWTGFPALGVSSGYSEDYGDNYNGVYLPTGTISNVTYTTGGTP